MASRSISGSSAMKLHDSYIYVGYASDDQGSDFTLVPSILTQYIGFITLSDPVSQLTASMFIDKWILLNGTAATVTVDDTTIGVNGFGELYVLDDSITEDKLDSSIVSQLYINASTTNTGHVELATDSEVQAGTDPARVITPSGLVSRTATTTRTGLVQLATALEVQTGSDNAKAITPSTLRSNVSTETIPGVIEIATSAEVQTGTDNTRAISPSGLNSRTATTTRTGLVELATPTEAITFVNNNVITCQTLMDVTAGLVTQIISIGDWNMDSNQTKNVSHGLGSNYKNIRSINVIIRDDTDTYYKMLQSIYLSGLTETYQGGGIELIDGTYITLTRYQSGNFDNTSYDSTSFNRGWVTISYYNYSPA